VGEKNAFLMDFMTKEDLGQVVAIEQASFSMPWSRNLFLSEFRSPSVSTLLVSLADDPASRTVTGYIVFWRVEDEMHILNLAVAAGCRRRGLAKQLVLAALKQAYEKGARRAFLEVRASNSGAQRLYSSLGFTGSFVRREYYDDPVEDAVVMTLEAGAFQKLARPGNDGN